MHTKTPRSFRNWNERGVFLALSIKSMAYFYYAKSSEQWFKRDGHRLYAAIKLKQSKLYMNR